MKIALILTLCALPVATFAEITHDKLESDQGVIEMHFIGHGTLMFKTATHVIHIDPVGRYADYSTLPKADLILITHEHGDHLDVKAITAIRKPKTQICLSQRCHDSLGEGLIMKNGDSKTIDDIGIKAVPAYNIQHKRDSGEPFHPKGVGNGYVLTIEGINIYVAGDTENIPEMADLKNIDVAFLPMNVPYTMTPEMVAQAAKSFMPTILYPYHYGNTDPQELVKLLKDTLEIEVRVRDLQ